VLTAGVIIPISPITSDKDNTCIMGEVTSVTRGTEVLPRHFFAMIRVGVEFVFRKDSWSTLYVQYSITIGRVGMFPYTSQLDLVYKAAQAPQ
jgi:hypothetical protein